MRFSIVNHEVFSSDNKNNKSAAGISFMQRMGGFPENGFLPVALRWISSSRRSFLYEFSPIDIPVKIGGEYFDLKVPWRSWLVTTPLNGQTGSQVRVRLFFQREPISSSLSDLVHAPWPKVAPGTGSYDYQNPELLTGSASGIARQLDSCLASAWGDGSPIAHSPFEELDVTDHRAFARRWAALSDSSLHNLDYEWWGTIEDLIAEIQAEEAHEEPVTTTAWLTQWM